MPPLFGDIPREPLGLLTRASLLLGPIFVTQIVLGRQSGGLGERPGGRVQAARQAGLAPSSLSQSRLPAPARQHLTDPRPDSHTPAGSVLLSGLLSAMANPSGQRSLGPLRHLQQQQKHPSPVIL